MRIGGTADPRIHIRGYDFSQVALNPQRSLSTILWPHPRAWAGLAAIWIFDSGGEFFHARPIAGPGGEIFAAVARSHRGTAATAANAGGIDRPA